MNGPIPDEPRGTDGAPPDDARPALGDVIAGAARSSGLGAVADGEPFDGRALLRTMGGVRGILEAVLPGIVFLVAFTAGLGLPLSLAASIGIAVVFTLLRVVGRTPVVQAIGGLLGVVVSAALALITNNPVDNFVPGLITNAVYGAVFLISALARWPLIGVAAGFLLGEGTTWRRERGLFRLYTVLTLAWAALFLVRLAVQYPLYLAGDVAALGTMKLILGIPLYAPLLVLTVLAVRSAHRRTAPSPSAAG